MGIFHGGLEGDHEHAPGVELFGELAGGEGFAEAHFGVPQEARDGAPALFPDGVEVVAGLFHGGALLGAHWKGLVPGAGNLPPGAERDQHGFHVFDRATHPFQFGLREAFPDESGPHLVIGKSRAVVALGRFIQLNGVVLDVGGLELLGTRCFTPRGVCPILGNPACAGSPIA